MKLELDNSRPLSDDAREGLNEVIAALAGLTVYTERMRDRDDRPVRCGDEKVDGFAVLVSLEERTMMQACHIGMNDLKQYATAVLSVIYAEEGPQGFYKFMMQLGPAVKAAAASRTTVSQTNREGVLQ